MRDFNMIEIVGSYATYIVTTQAGFKKVLKRYAQLLEIEDDLNYEISNYPKVYPSLVSFSRRYRGYHYIHAECNPVVLGEDNSITFKNGVLRNKVNV